MDCIMYRRFSEIDRSLEALTQAAERALELSTPARLEPYYNAYKVAYRAYHTDSEAVDDSILRAIAHFGLQALRNEQVTFTHQSLKTRLVQHLRAQQADEPTGEPPTARLSDDEEEEDHYDETPRPD